MVNLGDFALSTGLGATGKWKMCRDSAWESEA